MFGAFCSVVSIEIMETGEGAYDILHNELLLEKEKKEKFQYFIKSIQNIFFIQYIMYIIPGHG